FARVLESLSMLDRGAPTTRLRHRWFSVHDHGADATRAGAGRSAGPDAGEAGATLRARRASLSEERADAAVGRRWRGRRRGVGRSRIRRRRRRAGIAGGRGRFGGAGADGSARIAPAGDICCGGRAGSRRTAAVACFAAEVTVDAAAACRLADLHAGGAEGSAKAAAALVAPVAKGAVDAISAVRRA